MKTKKSEETKKAIIESAEKLFTSKNVNRVTVTEIAAAANLSKSIFYLYFDSKDDIVWYFLSFQAHSVIEPIKNLSRIGYEPKDIEYFIEALFKIVDENKKLFNMTHSFRFYSFIDKDRVADRYVNLFMDPIYEWFEAAKRKNKLKISNPQFTAYYFATSVHEMIDLYIENKLPFEREEIISQLKILLLKLLY